MESDTGRAYDFLDNTIHILIVDDEFYQLELLDEILKDIPLCSVSTASSARQASQFLDDPNAHVHLCLCDLGIADIDDDEFYLIRRYSWKTSFVVFTGSDSPVKGFTARSLGAQALVQKTIELTDANLLSIIENAYFDNLLIPLATGIHNDHILTAIETLRGEFPETVTLWAQRCGLSESYLRKIWFRSFLSQPKYMVFLFQLYQSAFRYYQDSPLLNEERFKFSSRRLTQSEAYKQQHTYWLRRRRILSSILEKKSVDS